MQLGGRAALLRIVANGNITQSVQDPTVKTLRYLDAWMHKAQGKGYFRSFMKLLYDAVAVVLY